MTKDQERKVKQWIVEEIGILQAKGATEADLQEDAFKWVVCRGVSERHKADFDADPDLKLALTKQGLLVMPPEECRKIADLLRKKGNFDSAYDFECLADERERGF